ncbi:uncharacterized protein LOC129230080 [Uloborus diversus]|uniref:uncharacterized protein LOC129230080 n=1 Tax=Uloborus diversus TaxID=327109 RepID=UPI00240A30B0|nr:uncharacterized protein LOC129230080 [Uloborus diversus]XP_054720447.1 uncharacterized protein LOC129230080 [Uloborus diversus]XP_054720448.1 uncharacterized protein LOC129230080 [Uloborus diversus]
MSYSMGTIIGRMFDFNSPLLELAVYDFAIQYAVFIVSAFLKTEIFYDLTGSITFIVLSHMCISWNPERSLRQMIQSGMILTWAVRLGTFLFIRVIKSGKDRRFDKVRENPKRFFVYWTLQGMWIFITLLPTMMLLSRPDYSPFTIRDYLGFGLWAFGFTFEVVADFQKSVFCNIPENKGKYITTGLWSVSRHPNYLGEILLWFGLYFSASSTFRGKEMLTVLCPVFDMFLITRISGIPILEKHGLQKWGNDPKYISYVKDTSILIPYLW